MSLRIIFAGTPDIACPTLQALIDSKHEIAAVYTQPDRPSGRGRKLAASPVKKLAQAHDLIVEQPIDLKNTHALARLEKHNCDIMVVIAYGQILSQQALDSAAICCLNLHASLLPKWRGAAPIPRAILAGDKQTGISLMQMQQGLDTGPVYTTATQTIAAEATTLSLTNELGELAAQLLITNLEKIADGKLQPQPQLNADATYAHKLSKHEGEIDWQKTAIEIDRQIRACNPWPHAFTFLNGNRINITQACITSGKSKPGTILEITKQGITVATGDGAIKILQLQLPSKRVMQVSECYHSLNESWQNQVLG